MTAHRDPVREKWRHWQELAELRRPLELDAPRDWRRENALPDSLRWRPIAGRAGEWTPTTFREIAHPPIVDAATRRRRSR